MSYRLMFIINAVVAAVFGLALLAIPGTVFPFFGVTDAVVGMDFLARFFGGTLLVIAALLWFLQGSKEFMKSEAFALMLASAGAFALTIVGMTSYKLIRANGWILLTVFAILALGYVYLVFGFTVKKKR